MEPNSFVDCYHISLFILQTFIKQIKQKNKQINKQKTKLRTNMTKEKYEKWMLVQCFEFEKDIRSKFIYEICRLAYLKWCYKGWTSNIFIVVDTSYSCIHYSKNLRPSILTPS